MPLASSTASRDDRVVLDIVGVASSPVLLTVIVQGVGGAEHHPFLERLHDHPARRPPASRPFWRGAGAVDPGIVGRLRSAKEERSWWLILRDGTRSEFRGIAVRPMNHAEDSGGRRCRKQRRSLTRLPPGPLHPFEKERRAKVTPSFSDSWRKRRERPRISPRPLRADRASAPPRRLRACSRSCWLESRSEMRSRRGERNSPSRARGRCRTCRSVVENRPEPLASGPSPPSVPPAIIAFGPGHCVGSLHYINETVRRKT